MLLARNGIVNWSLNRCRTPSLRRNLSSADCLLLWCMTQISCGAILFDLDGVLVDSTPAVIRVWTRWALRRGFDADEVVRTAHGRPSIETIREYLPHGDH